MKHPCASSRSLGVTSHAELEARVKEEFRQGDVRSAWEEVLEVEQAWNSFLAGMDSSLREGQGAGALQEGDTLPLHLALKEVRSGGRETTVGQVLEGGEKEFVHLVLLRHFS